MRIVIGANTYGYVPRCEGFFRSLAANLIPYEHEIIKLMVDDGTPNPGVVDTRARFCKQNGIDFISHGSNKGIPASWNTILNYAANKQADVVVISNDDVRFLEPDWLKYITYCFQHNENVGTVGLALVNGEEPFNPEEERFDGNPGTCGCAVGCFFAVQPQVALQVENPDGTRGYFELLRSFHEEIFLGFALAEMGYLSVMLPFSAVRHMGGQTFANNHELVFMDFPKGYNFEEFLNYARALPWHIPAYEKTYIETGKVDRMMGSRFMAAKHWGLLEPGVPRFQEIKGETVDCWSEPQKPRHATCVDIWPERKWRWLDRHGNERQLS